IPSAFVDVPRTDTREAHIALLVGTDLPASAAPALGLDSALFVPRADELWMPLETTTMGKGFTAAWALGARLYPGWHGHIVDVNASIQEYPPTIPEERAQGPLVDPAIVRGLLAADRDSL